MVTGDKSSYSGLPGSAFLKHLGVIDLEKLWAALGLMEWRDEDRLRLLTKAWVVNKQTWQDQSDLLGALRGDDICWSEMLDSLVEEMDNTMISGSTTSRKYI